MALTMADFGLVRRPISRRSSLAGLRGLGAGEDPCGPQPTLASGEYAQCCPSVGWVVYSLGESQYGLCERAAAAAGVAAASDGSTTTTLPTDPIERVAELRRRLDERRATSDEQRFEQQKQELQLRFVAARMQAIQQAEAARVQAERDAETRRLVAETKAREAKIQSEKTKQWLIAGAVALAAAKAVGVI